jgi:chemotaxis protein CheZ
MSHGDAPHLHAKNLERDQVEKIINSVVSKVESVETISRESIFNELKSLQKIIDETRKEIGITGAGDISEKHIPTATDELDAVVEATAEATGTIMDAVEEIEDIAEKLDEENASKISENVTKIYEACSFQDITGQRITKVVTTLKAIEEKVDKLMAIMGEKMPGALSKPRPAEEEKTGDAALLNGPQMADQAITQNEIDQLLDDLFD